MGELSADGEVAAEAQRSRPVPAQSGPPSAVEDALRLRLRAGLQGDLAAGDAFAAGMRIDSGDVALTSGARSQDTLTIDGVAPGDQATDAAFLRELWVALGAGDGLRRPQLVATLGRARQRLGDGLLLDAYATGAAATLEWHALGLAGGLIWPGTQPLPSGPALAFATFSVEFDRGARAGLFWAHQSGDGDAYGAGLDAQALADVFAAEVAETLRGAAAGATCLDAPPSLSGAATIDWFGAEAELPFRRGTLSAAALVDAGRLSASARLRDPTCVQALARAGLAPVRTAEADALGFAAVARGRLHATAGFYPGFFAVFLSGAEGTPDRPAADYGGALSVAPYFERPRLFFDAAAGPRGERNGLSPAGLDGRGAFVLAPTLLFAPNERFELDAALAYLLAPKPNPETGGRTYGLELDLRADLELTRRLVLFAEFDALRRGDFHPAPLADGTELRATIGLSIEAPLAATQ